MSTGSAVSTAGWAIADHLEARRRGVPATETITAVLADLDRLVHDDPAVVVGVPLRALALEAAADADRRAAAGEALPLHGVPFVVKDNIDVGGAATTCACPSFSYLPPGDATVVARLRAAGAVPVAKVNLDQFATGLVGVRSPLGAPRNPIDPALVPGGSSSGSAVAVARGIVPFSLGTDTAGSGRVPAAMCGIVGWKPTVGRFPSKGVVPAVQTIDCVSVFAATVADARLAAAVAAGFEPSDPFSRPEGEARPAARRVGVPSSFPEGLIDRSRAAWDAFVARLGELPGVSVVPFDLEPLLEAGRLLYGGTFVAERTASVGSFLAKRPPDADPTVSQIILGGVELSAVDAYACGYRLSELRAQTRELWDACDAIAVPTIPDVATLDEVRADPIGANSRIGTLTTFTNLLDMDAIALPATTGHYHGTAVPYSVQLLGPAWSEEALADLAEALGTGPTAPIEPAPVALRRGEIGLVVVGAHLSGMPLNHQLTSRHARLVAATMTSSKYRLHALPGTTPPKPGLERVTGEGSAIVVELWALAPGDFASFVTEVPPPLAIGSVELADGTWHKGFVCEPVGLEGAVDVTSFGGWRAYVTDNAPTGGVT